MEKIEMVSKTEIGNVEFGEPVEITVIPFWQGQKGEKVEGFFSDIGQLPDGLGAKPKYELTLFADTQLTVAVRRGEVAKRVVHAGGGADGSDVIVLPTHRNLMMLMQELNPHQGDVVQIVLDDIKDVPVQIDGQEETRQMRLYTVRPGKKKVAGKK
jgi:hypothetical protein